MTESKDGRTPKDQPRGHVFDGIFEYDNDLPRWWVVLFILTIIFSAGYLAWYHLGVFPSASLAEEYESARALAKANADEKIAAAAAQMASLPPPSPGETAGDTASLAAGKEAYDAMCVPCHGASGQGVIGPNLTDEFWIHGASRAAVEKVIASGVVEKGMPAWGEVLGSMKVRAVVAYLVSLQGSNPGDAKAPQGEPGTLK